MARVAIMKQNLWLDKNTRQILVKFASFNGEQRLFNFVSISFSHSFGGIFAGSNKVSFSLYSEITLNGAFFWLLLSIHCQTINTPFQGRNPKYPYGAVC